MENCAGFRVRVCRLSTLCLVKMLLLTVVSALTFLCQAWKWRMDWFSNVLGKHKAVKDFIEWIFSYYKPVSIHPSTMPASSLKFHCRTCVKLHSKPSVSTLDSQSIFKQPKANLDLIEMNFYLWFFPRWTKVPPKKFFHNSVEISMKYHFRVSETHGCGNVSQRLSVERRAEREWHEKWRGWRRRWTFSAYLRVFV